MPAPWTVDRLPDLHGRTVLVTGASSGLGLEATRQLARRGAHVVMAVRDEAKGQAAAAGVRSEVPGARLAIGHLDLADLASVRAFAAEVVAGPPIDVLVNNAGIMVPPHTTTPAGHELQIATNHLGHFALTGLVLPALAGPSPRVVTVTSVAARRGVLDLGALPAGGPRSPMAAYAWSKLANASFGIELDRRLRAAGSPVASVLAHPGYVATPLQHGGPHLLAGIGMRVASALFATSTARGTLPLLFAAADPSVLGGQLIGPDGIGELRGAPTVLVPPPQALDPDLARGLWEASEQATGVRLALPDPH